MFHEPPEAYVRAVAASDKQRLAENDLLGQVLATGLEIETALRCMVYLAERVLDPLLDAELTGAQQRLKQGCAEARKVLGVAPRN